MKLNINKISLMITLDLYRFHTLGISSVYLIVRVCYPFLKSLASTYHPSSMYRSERADCSERITTVSAANLNGHHHFSIAVMRPEHKEVL